MNWENLDVVYDEASQHNFRLAHEQLGVSTPFSQIFVNCLPIKLIKPAQSGWSQFFSATFYSRTDPISKWCRRFNWKQFWMNSFEFYPVDISSELSVHIMCYEDRK